MAQIYLENLSKLPGVPEDMVSDCDETYAGQFFTKFI
jgi:hypothetical protein